mmetsp:Transcript_18717/g.37850  ORF Transcript_18717/g.37850 Transcript_18717/m.37850 type:complete len:533 (-) Transcript_18717:118-1716(-)
MISSIHGPSQFFRVWDLSRSSSECPQTDGQLTCSVNVSIHENSGWLLRGLSLLWTCRKRGKPEDPGPESTKVVETLFECYDVPEEFRGPGMNDVWIPEDFLSQLQKFPEDCRIQVIDLHGPSFGVVDCVLDALLKHLNVYGGGWGSMLVSSASYLESKKAEDRGYPMKSCSSRYRHANRAVIYTYQAKEQDQNGAVFTRDYKVIFRVCPHIMHSQIASAIIYCPAQEPGRSFEHLGGWDDRLFKDAAQFGQKLREAERMLADSVQPDGRAEASPFWRRANKVFLAYHTATADPIDANLLEMAKINAEGLFQAAELAQPVAHLAIPPYDKQSDGFPTFLKTQVVNESWWFRFVPPGGAEAAVGGKDLGNFIRLCIAGFKNGFRNHFAHVQASHANLLRLYVPNTIIEWPEEAADDGMHDVPNFGGEMQDVPIQEGANGGGDVSGGPPREVSGSMMDGGMGQGFGPLAEGMGNMSLSPSHGIGGHAHPGSPFGAAGGQQQIFGMTGGSDVIEVLDVHNHPVRIPICNLMGYGLR